MHKIRKIFSIKFFWGLLALYILNCSVDAPDAYADYMHCETNFNDQDSIAELIIEKLLGYEDAVDEYDMENEQEYSGKKGLAVDFFIIPPYYIINQHNILYKKHAKGNSKIFHLIPYFEIHSPPPEV